MEWRSSIKCQCNSKENATAKLADFVSGLEFECLPISTVNKAKDAILDYIGVLLAGYTKGNLLSKTLISLIIESGGVEEATIIGPAIKVPVANAALCNGVLSHVVELDDGHRVARGHPGVTVISSALAMAERFNSTGKELITAIVAGYDIFVRLASAVNPSHLKRGFHTTGTCGALAASAAAAKILKLNASETANAFGIAGIQSAGLLEVTENGQMAKVLHPGKAAQAGVLSALLARNGVKGPITIIEGAKGFVKAMSDECNYDLMLKGLNEIFNINGCYIKLYPSCRHTHSPVDAALALINKNKLNHLQIKNILIKTYPTAIYFAGSIFQPRTPEEAKFSIAYCVSAAIVKGKLGIKELESGSLRDASILTLIEKTRIESEQNFENYESNVKGAEVIITLQEGSEFSWKVSLPKGEPENPISQEEIIKKFTDCTKESLTKCQQNKIIYKILEMNQNDHIKDLISKLQ